MEYSEIDMMQNLTERGDTYLKAYLKEKSKNEFASSQLKMLAQFIEGKISQRDVIQLRSIIKNMEK
jgi:hypothetical protein